MNDRANWARDSWARLICSANPSNIAARQWRAAVDNIRRGPDVASEETHAANALPVAGSLIYSSSYPRTAEKLTACGIAVVLVDVSELQKGEGAVTCCSLVFTTQ